MLRGLGLDQRLRAAVSEDLSTDANAKFRPLFRDELRFVVSPLHPWAKAGRVDRGEITRQRFILCTRSSYMAYMIEDYFKREDLVLPTTIELGNMEAIKELVKLGLGISILAPWIAQRELAEGSLTTLPLGARRLERSWGILLRRGQHLTLAQQTFIGLCSAVADNLEHRTRQQAGPTVLPSHSWAPGHGLHGC